MAYKDTKFEDVTQEIWESVAGIADEKETIEATSAESLADMEKQRDDAIQRAVDAEASLKEQKQKYVDAFFASNKQPDVKEPVDNKPKVSYPTTMKDIDALFEKGN
jgi:hypothetical protein